MKSFYGSLTDINYLARAICLFQSFERYLGPGTKFALFCVDDESVRMLNRLGFENCVVVPLKEFETDELRAVKPNRIGNEYTWTFKPAILKYAFDRDPDLDWVVYLDSDIMAFGNPDDALASAMDASVIITPHRSTTTEIAAEERIAGSCNAGYVAFRNSATGRDALQWWHERCLELCPSVPTPDGIYADQTYLDRLSGKFPGVLHSSNRGLNAGPWNVVGIDISLKDGAVHLNGDELLLYHFQGLKIHGRKLFDLYPGHVKIPTMASTHIYRPYVRRIARIFEAMRRIEPGFSAGIDPLMARPKLALNKVKRLVLGLNNMAVA